MLLAQERFGRHPADQIGFIRDKAISGHALRLDDGEPYVERREENAIFSFPSA